MSYRSRIAVALPAIAALCIGARPAEAQFYNNGCSSCASSVPVQQVASCTPMQPVYNTCYQTVPVTTYQRERQTVKVPYYQTAMEEREVTVYRPVQRTREVEVPTVSYQNVTEMRTVNRDMGRWVTNYQPIQRCSPCQVDPRPGFIGWMNRTGYSFRTAFMPSYRTSRQYVPSMVTCQVPVTRQVAVRGTRRVSVVETQMVAERKTERYPVQKLAYREEEITVMRPQTAYRTVPIGTSVAYAPGYGSAVAYAPGLGGTSTAFLPIIDRRSTQTAANNDPVPDPGFNRSSRVGVAPSNEPFREDSANSRADRSLDEFNREESATGEDPFRRSSFSEPAADPGTGSDEVLPAWPAGASTGSPGLTIPVAYQRPQTDSRPDDAPVQLSGWRRTETNRRVRSEIANRAAARRAVASADDRN